jgi:hypothetical protein
MITYKEISGQFGKLPMVVRNDGSHIPFDPTNTDYQEYLKWVAEGNTPEPADE